MEVIKLSNKTSVYNKLCPIHRCDIFEEYQECMIIGQSSSMFFLRFKEIGYDEWTRERIISIKNAKIQDKVGIFNSETYEFVNYISAPKNNKFKTRCPHCYTLLNIDIFDTSLLSWTCPTCQTETNKNYYNIIYDTDSFKEEKVVKNMFIEKKIVKCPVCKAENSKYHDKFNKIIRCGSCNTYYVTKYNLINE